MRRRSIRFALTAAVAIALTMPLVALGDEPARGQLLVPGDHHLPGETIEVTGYDLDPGATVSLMLESGAYGIAFGEGTVGSDGNLSISTTIPTNFPLGYANVVATSADGTNLKTVILVGERAEGPNGQAGAAAPLDDRTFGLILAGIGTVLFLVAAAWYIRSRPKGPRSPD